MIVEMRTYTLRPGTVAEYLRIYEAEGLALQRKILGNFLGSYSTEIGPLNQVVHLWAFDSLDERQARRDRLAADPAWQRAVGLFIHFFVTQESKILVPAAFAKHVLAAAVMQAGPDSAAAMPPQASTL